MSVFIKITSISSRHVQIAGTVLTQGSPSSVDITSVNVRNDLRRQYGLWAPYSGSEAANPFQVNDPSALTAASGTLASAGLAVALTASAASGTSVLDHNSLVTAHNTLTTQYNHLQDDLEALWGVLGVVVTGLKADDIAES